MPRGADPAKHTKLGPGGIADVEWTVQLLQLQHAYRLPGPPLHTVDRCPASRARTLESLTGWTPGTWRRPGRFASRIRNQIMLMRGRGSDSLPSDNRELASLAELLGYGPGSPLTCWPTTGG